MAANCLPSRDSCWCDKKAKTSTSRIEKEGKRGGGGGGGAGGHSHKPPQETRKEPPKKGKGSKGEE